jgi:hypothetical protein
MREIMMLVEARHINEANEGVWKGKRFWSGAFDTRDGQIIEVHTYEEAVGADMHHSFYFSSNAIEMMDDDEAHFFWIDNGKVNTEFRQAAASAKLVAIVTSQIQFVSPLNYWKRGELITPSPNESFKVFYVDGNFAVLQRTSNGHTVYEVAYRDAQTAEEGSWINPIDKEFSDVWQQFRLFNVNNGVLLGSFKLPPT